LRDFTLPKEPSTHKSLEIDFREDVSGCPAGIAHGTIKGHADFIIFLSELLLTFVGTAPAGSSQFLHIEPTSEFGGLAARKAARSNSR
jgi:hypothetical protein